VFYIDICRKLEVMEFKGTKGHWELNKSRNGVLIDGKLMVTCWSENTDDLDNQFSGESWISMRNRTENERIERTEVKPKFNALLISKAPEMLEMLKNINEALNMGLVVNKDSFTDRQIKQLIKEATEL